MIHPTRVKFLNQQKLKNRRFVLYWMQASQRIEYNHALEGAIQKANELNKPLVVYFGITDDFPEANERHYYFMLQGLREVQQGLSERGVKMVVEYQSPVIGVTALAKQADLVVTDAGYLRIQKSWRAQVANQIDCPLMQIETDVIVPVETASDKENYSAATLRPRIKRQLDSFLLPLKSHDVKVNASNLDLDVTLFDISNIDAAISKLKIDRSVRQSHYFEGGPAAAKRQLKNFLELKFDKYAELRNDPSLDYLSNMSPYLHFGQISPLYIALKALDANGAGVDAFLEELIVRRELSMNFVHYNPDYDQLNALPNWARQTLAEHTSDLREYLYNLEEFEKAQTHDPYWNAAQMEMVITGKMHGYMRMYWGKKILEWTPSPQKALQIALYLNNKYELDGRDPNGFTGVAWCLGKHDRVWTERPIFGKVRYMNANGLKRKFDIDAYVRNVIKKGE